MPTGVLQWSGRVDGGDAAAHALRASRPAVFWTDRDDGPEAAPSLRGALSADLVVVGGGFTGLWAAVQALEEDPDRRVVLVEAERCGFGASSRNGGFCDASLTHGLANGVAQWPDELATLVRLGRENLAALEATVARAGIAADVHRVPELAVATEDWQVDELAAGLDLHRAHGDDVELLDRTQVQERVASPTYVGGVLRRNDLALVDPARLAWGLRAAAESLGARVFERSPVTGLSRSGRRGPLEVRTAEGSIRAERVVLATNAYRGPSRRPRRYVIPVYDHVIVTEPLTADQRAAIGWRHGDGVADAANQFHYYRLTEDGRILFGGYDATYHFGNGLRPELDQRAATPPLLTRHLLETFPALEGIGVTHRWGGPIGTTTRFTATWGTGHGGRSVWVAGYTGLGVGASRFGARVALDLVDGRSTERTELAMVRRRPFPFPPEPLRWAGVTLTRRALQRADRRAGRRGPWLRLLDRFGIGFDT